MTQVFVFTKADNENNLSIRLDAPESELLTLRIERDSDRTHKIYEMTIEQAQWLRDILNEWLGD